MTLVIIIIFVAIASTFLFVFKDRNNSNKSKPKQDISLQKNVVLLDVRTPQEFSANHAKGAVNFDLQEIQKGSMPAVAKNQIIYVYCRSGNRSAQAKKVLEQNGFTNVTDIGGLNNLGNYGLEIVSGS